MKRRYTSAGVSFLFISLAILLPSAAVAVPIYMIGPGAGFSAGELDSAGARINVERDPVYLLGGRYQVLDFAMKTGDAAGYVTPFLATGSPSSYTVVWVGDRFDPPASGIQTAAYVPGTEELVLAANAYVYAGFYQSNNMVYLASNVGFTDHDNTPTEPTFVGEVVTAFSHPNLARTYAFEVNVANIPEPATLSLLALGALALLRRRTRRL